MISQQQNPDRARRRARRTTVAVAVAAGLTLGGGAAVAYAAGGSTATPSNSTSSPAVGHASGPAQPGGTGKAEGPAAPGRPAPRPHMPHIDGTVRTASGSTVTVADRDGFTRTIVVTSATRYSSGLSAALPAGTRIHAEGTVDANGTSLDATSVGTAPTRPAGDHGKGPKTGPRTTGLLPAPPRGAGTPPAAPGEAGTPPAAPGGTATPPAAGRGPAAGS